MTANKHTPGPWFVHKGSRWSHVKAENGDYIMEASRRSVARHHADARLIAAAPELLEALIEGRRAIGDHHAPNDCYATGPMTGNHYRDLVECPACSFIAMYDTAIAKATGGAA